MSAPSRVRRCYGNSFYKAMPGYLTEWVEPYRNRTYPPLETLRLFVSQELSADRAYQDVVGRRLSERLAQGQSASALNTGSYCDARQRLPLTLPMALIGARLDSMAPAPWRWRPVRQAV